MTIDEVLSTPESKDGKAKVGICCDQERNFTFSRHHASGLDVTDKDDERLHTEFDRSRPAGELKKHPWLTPSGVAPQDLGGLKAGHGGFRAGLRSVDVNDSLKDDLRL